MKKCGFAKVFLMILMLAIPQSVFAQDAAENTTKEDAYILEDVRVTASQEDETVVVSPSATTIQIRKYKSAGNPKSVVDILKDQAIIDFRGESDLVPDEDDIYMRGFDAHRFTTALDGMTLDYGRNAWGGTRSMVVDFSSLPLDQLETIEILPGPHSALYGGKSIGGVINLKTRRPEKYEDLKPDGRVTTSYGSYDTQNYSVNLNGGVDSFVYGLSYRHYRTDGYLRNNSAQIDNYYAKFGYILPSDGYINLSVAYTDKDKENVARNEIGGIDYDSAYPETVNTSNYAWKKEEQTSEEYTYRLNYEQPSSMGLWTLGAFYGVQDWSESYYRDKYTGRTPEAKPAEIERYAEDEMTNKQAGGRIQDEIKLSEDNTLTVGFDMIQMWEYPTDYNWNERHDIAITKAGYLQDKWDILSRLELTTGLRYEDVNFWKNNYNFRNGGSFITGEGHWIRRDRNQWIPKSFMTYDLNGLADVLKDTSVSVGVSKIWDPLPFCYGCFPCCAQVWVKPEHGVGYDFILNKKFWNNIKLKINYSFYIIEDYVAYNSKYAKYTPGPGKDVPPGLECSDYLINLEEMRRQGVEVEINGNIFDNLSFYANYAFTELKSMGGEPAGEEAEGERAKHRVNVGLRYNLLKNTLLMLDYRYQDKQIANVSVELEDYPGVYDWYTVEMDAYQVFDFAIEQRLFQKYGGIENGLLKFYISNLFDEAYENTRGYPMTDRTFGAALSFSF